MRKLSPAAKTAVGGMLAAISVVIMIPTAIDLFVYALPAIASMLILVCVIELGKKWSLCVYAAASIISFIIIPNKEAVVMYAAFFGYYPIVKSIFESKLPKAVEYILKFVVFNAAVVVSFLILVKLFGIPFNELMGIENEKTFFGKYAAPILLAFGNVAFILFDFCLSLEATVYLRTWQKKIRKMFKFK